MLKLLLLVLIGLLMRMLQSCRVLLILQIQPILVKITL